MIDEKYRRNPENITDFLKKERFRYISKMEFEFEDEKYNEIELCDVVLEMIKSFTDENGEYFIYKIEEKNYQYDVPYLKEKILENFIFDELYILVDKKFNIISILNIENIVEKINLVQDEVKKIENVNLNLKYATLENLKKFASDEDRITKFIKNYRFLNVFLNNLKEKKEEIIIFGNKVIPVFLDVREENGVSIINGKQSYYKLSSSKLKEIFEKEYQRSFKEIVVEYKRLLLQESNVTQKVDSLIEISSKNEIRFSKREFLQKIRKDMKIYEGR